MTTEPHVTCREVAELLTDYLEGALPAFAQAQLDAHLARCEGCGAALAQLRETIRVTGTLTEDQVRAPQLDAIRAVFRTWRSETT